MVTVTVHYFAVLRERRGRSLEVVGVEEGTTAARLYRELFPPGPEGPLPVAYARNLISVAGDEVLQDGDEVAFLPPLGGG